LAEEITLAMKIGVLDLLCIIPQDEIREFGIPYVRSIIEKYLSRADIEKWDTFWGTYFEGQWMPILDSWNICTQAGTYKKFMNRTNNGLERYIKHFNGLFPKHNPSLIEFTLPVLLSRLKCNSALQFLPRRHRQSMKRSFG
jgi:hypothetical protein